MKEYRIFFLTPEGGVLDQRILLCTDDDEARETAKVLTDRTPVEIWKGPLRILRFEPMQ